jgi:adenylosuccinate lyase
MSEIWSAQNKFEKMLEVEIFACEAMAKLGHVPKKALAVIQKKAKVNVERIEEIEKVVKHESIAFLTAVAESVGAEGKFLHLGLTSSDVLDTAGAAQLRQSTLLIISQTKILASLLLRLAKKYKYTEMMGRTHGMHAEPMTFGLKALSWHAQILRCLDRLNFALETISYGKISGAVGTMANVDPSIEKYVCKKMNLTPEPISTQIIPRDRYSVYVSVIAHLGSALECIALEIRHLQRTEIMELSEPFTKGQKGSSAMPHKKNPIISENICGLARLLRGYSVSAMENIVLWHERDMSHSSVERVILPDASEAVYYMLIRMCGLIEGLNVYEKNMLANMAKTQNTIFSGAVLLALLAKGLDREEAYALSQKAAFEASERNMPFCDICLKMEIADYLTPKEIKVCCDISSHFKNIDYIFKRVSGKHDKIKKKA